ncbi:hypothetical protein ACRAWB_18250 [Leifsonia poae]|uniref:hypothetical protein n=1 Tax=Leifsonia poae TaxID=110933 RepID=UPI003D68F7AA
MTGDDLVEENAQLRAEVKKWRDMARKHEGQWKRLRRGISRLAEELDVSLEAIDQMLEVRGTGSREGKRP